MTSLAPPATDPGSTDDPGGEVLVRCRGVERHFTAAGQVVRAVDGVDLDVRRGRLVALHGRSGSGKTTLLHCMGGLDEPTAGSITIDGVDVASLAAAERVRLRRERLAFVFQSFGLLPLLSAAENVEVPLRLARVPADERRARVEELLRTVGLGERMDHRPHELSGGEQQRVAIARALANRPALLLADEPTGQLDSRTGTTVLRLLRALVERDGLTAVVSTHDPEMMALAHERVELRDGRVVRPTPPAAAPPPDADPPGPAATPPTPRPIPTPRPPATDEPEPERRPRARRRSPFAPPEDPA